MVMKLFNDMSRAKLMPDIHYADCENIIKCDHCTNDIKYDAKYSEEEKLHSSVIPMLPKAPTAVSPSSTLLSSSARFFKEFERLSSRLFWMPLSKNSSIWIAECNPEKNSQIMDRSATLKHYRKIDTENAPYFGMFSNKKIKSFPRAFSAESDFSQSDFPTYLRNRRMSDSKTYRKPPMQSSLLRFGSLRPGFRVKISVSSVKEEEDLPEVNEQLYVLGSSSNVSGVNNSEPPSDRNDSQPYSGVTHDVSDDLINNNKPDHLSIPDPPSICIRDAPEAENTNDNHDAPGTDVCLHISENNTSSDESSLDAPFYPVMKLGRSMDTLLRVSCEHFCKI